MPVFGSEAAIIFLIPDTDTIDRTMVPSINRTIATIMGRHIIGVTDTEFITATTIIITITIKLTRCSRDQ
jgi:hypothetical protein